MLLDRAALVLIINPYRFSISLLPMPLFLIIICYFYSTLFLNYIILGYAGNIPHGFGNF